VCLREGRRLARCCLGLVAVLLALVGGGGADAVAAALLPEAVILTEVLETAAAGRLTMADVERIAVGRLSSS
jgi:hypothetical protein